MDINNNAEIEEENKTISFNPKAMGLRLKEIRKYRKNVSGKHLTVSNVSQLTGLTPSYISQVEGGFKTPRLSYLLHIMKALQAEPNYIFQDYYQFQLIDDKKSKDLISEICENLNALNKEKLELVYDLVTALRKNK